MAAAEATSYEVKALQVVVKIGQGQEIYLSQGSRLPEAADADHVKHLLARGLVAKVTAQPAADK